MLECTTLENDHISIQVMMMGGFISEADTGSEYRWAVEGASALILACVDGKAASLGLRSDANTCKFER